jgi:hypothetical protein
MLEQQLAQEIHRLVADLPVELVGSLAATLDGASANTPRWL